MENKPLTHTYHRLSNHYFSISKRNYVCHCKYLNKIYIICYYFSSRTSNNKIANIMNT